LHKELLKNKINDLIFLPHLNNANLLWIIKNSIFLVSPSIKEGHNLVINEAIAENINVLCSDIKVHREFYDNQCIFFDLYDSNDFIDKFNYLLDKPNIIKKSTFYSRTYDNIADEYIKIFNSIS